MADLQISNLPALAEAGIQATDVLALADLSATETKKVTVKDLVAAAAQFLDAGDIPAAKVGSGISAGSLADGSVTNVKLANDSVSFGGVSVDLGAADATPAFNLSDATSYPTSALVGTITNAQLAGSIANAKLANSSVSLGGITVALGASDATPAFDLTDATNYKTTNLVGTITNAQLAGSIDVSKLVGSNVNFGGVTVALGGSDTTPAFNLSDATNYPTSALVGTITNAQLAGSIDATKLVSGSITSTQLAANSVTDSELANNAVDSGAIQSGAITNDKVETSTSATTGLDGATKIRDATITPAKLNTSNLDRSLNVASGNLGINNTVTAATRSGISYNAQGLITGTVALAAADLPVATASAVGGVSVGTGLSVNGSGVLTLATSVTGATVSGITFNNTGQITAATALTASDLPVATTSAKGAVQITSGGGLTVDGSGNLTTSTSGISAGTYQSITVNNKGVATAGAALTAALVPDLAASKITSGSFDAARIANDSIDGTKLSNSSTALFQSIAQSGYPTAQFSGQILFDTVSEDAFIWDGNAWQAITTLTKGSLVFGGTYNANTSQMVATTSAGIAAGLAVGSNLPTASATTDGVYVVVATGGTPSSPAPAIAFSPPDYILGVTNSAGSSWNEVDLSQTVAGQVASNISFSPYGQLSSTNVQDALQELETEKLAKAGGTVTGQVLIGNTGSLVFEGSTVDAYETTLTVADPTTSDKTITLPNVTGTVITTGDTGTVTGTMLADDTIQNVDIKSDAAIAFSKLAALTSAQILVGNGSNVATGVAVTGDISINNAGLTAIAAGVIVDADISGSAAITGSKIATGTTSAVGVLQLTDSATSTSATTAATPAAVKIAKDAADAAATTANAALPKAGGTMTGNLILDNAKELRLSEGDSDGANYTGLKAQAQSGDITLTLPAVAPTAGQVLKADASTPTTLTWAADSATDSTKMPLAGGTFTGDVTFTGDSSNGLWDKSASAFVANLTGNVTGNVSGSAATVTGAAQSAITSLGTLTGLTVSGDVSIADKIVHTGDTNTALRFPAADTFSIETGGSERARIDSSGRLLIGSTTNVHSFNDKVQISSTDAYASIYLSRYSDNANAAYIHFNKSRSGTIGGNTIVQDDDLLGRIYFEGNDGNAPQPAAFIEAHVDGAPGATDMPGRLEFLTTADGAATPIERMRIDSSGKVGIGETSMDALLVIKGDSDANTTPSIRLKDGSDTREAWISNTAGDLVLANGGDDNTPHCELKMFDGNIMRFSTSNTERMRIDSSGRLLIGHTASLSEGCSLQVARANDNTVELFGYSANANGTRINFTKSRGGAIGDNVIVQDGDALGQLHFRSADGSNYYRSAAIEAYVDGTPGATDVPGRLVFSTTADGASTQSERMRIDSSGKVGIGTSSPASYYCDQLVVDIGSNVQSGITIVSENDKQGQLAFADGTSGDARYRGYIDYHHNTDRLSFGVIGQEALAIDSSKNATFAGTVSDSKGNLRSIPQRAPASNYTLVADDAGRHVIANGYTITVPNQIFSAGDAITIINNHGSNAMTITCSAPSSVFKAGDATAVTSITLNAKGMVTFLCNSGSPGNDSQFFVSGAGMA